MLWSVWIDNTIQPKDNNIDIEITGSGVAEMTPTRSTLRAVELVWGLPVRDHQQLLLCLRTYRWLSTSLSLLYVLDWSTTLIYWVWHILRYGAGRPERAVDIDKPFWVGLPKFVPAYSWKQESQFLIGTTVVMLYDSYWAYTAMWRQHSRIT